MKTPMTRAARAYSNLRSLAITTPNVLTTERLMAHRTFHIADILVRCTQTEASFTAPQPASRRL